MSAALSAISSTALTVSKIRKNRSKPGLRPQHLAGLKLVAEICGGSLEGAAVGSSNIKFQPGNIRSGTFKADPGTAGSCCLLAQVASASENPSGRSNLLGGAVASKESNCKQKPLQIDAMPA